MRPDEEPISFQNLHSLIKQVPQGKHFLISLIKKLQPGPEPSCDHNPEPRVLHSLSLFFFASIADSGESGFAQETDT